jgi:KilA-N domain/Protein of unknown function (DUF3627)
MMTITELVYEPINSKYGWAKYGDFTVLMDRETGYINATKLCDDGAKNYSDWTRLKHTSSLCQEVSSSRGIPLDELSRCIVGGQEPLIRGTYLHPLLIPALAIWISPSFAVKASILINEHLVREYRETIRVKDTTIDKLLTELREARTVIDKLDTRVETLDTRVETLDTRLTVANENIIETLDTLGAVSNKQVPFERIDPNLREQFVVMWIGESKYRVIRTQRRCTLSAYRKIKAEFTDARVVLKMDSRPNSKELWNAIKLQLKEVGCKVTVNDVTLGPATEERMLQIIQKCNNEKFDSFISARTKAREAEEKRCADTRDINTEGEEQESVAVDPVADEVAENEDEEAEAEEEQKETAQTLLMRTRPQLLELARQTGRKGFSKLKKVDLVIWLLGGH